MIKRFLIRYGLVSILSIFFIPNLFAVTLNELVVIAQRLPGSILSTTRLGGHVTVINAEQLARFPQQNIGELLNQQSGLVGSDSLGNGLEQRISLRGIDGEGKSVLVLVDGIKISESYDNTVAWKMIPLESIERIEILRGGSTALFGEGSIGGVINIILKKSIKSSHRFKLDTGSFDLLKTSIEGNDALNDQWLWHYFFAQENYEGHRQNGFYKGKDGLVKINFKTNPAVSMETLFQAHFDNTGIAGNMTGTEWQTDAYRLWPSSGFAIGDHYQNQMLLLSERINFSPELQTQHSAQVYFRSRKNNAVTLFPQNISSDTLGALWQSEWLKFFFLNNLVWGAETAREKSRSDSTWSVDQIERRSTSVYTATDWLWDDWSLHSGLRADWIDWGINSTSTALSARQAMALSPKLSLVRKLSQALEVYAVYYESFKGPEANTFFFAPPTFLPNSTLQPEISRSFEIGQRYQTNSLEWSLNFFHSRIEKEILFNSISFSNENFDSLHRGIENSLQWHLNSWEIALQSAWFEAVFVGGNYDQKRIPLSPGQKHSLSLSYQWMNNLRTGLQYSKLIDQYVLNDFNNQFPAESYETLDGSLEWKWQNHRLSFAIKNILDARYSAFSTSDGVSVAKFNPAPGRNFQLGMTWEF